MNVDVQMSSLQTYEWRLLTRKEDDVSQALLSKSSLREDQKTSDYEVNHRGRGQGRGQGWGWGRGGQGDRNFKKFEKRSTFSNYAKACGKGGYGKEVLEEDVNNEIISIIYNVLITISMEIMPMNVGAILTRMLKKKLIMWKSKIMLI